MNPVNRFLYLNMNYHVEHHMFPLVPYHALPKLHETIKDDCPTPYPSIFEAWRELLPAVLRQVRDPGFWVKRKLPTPTLRAEAPSTSPIFTAKGRPVNGWIEICASSFLKKEDVLRFDHDRKSFAIYRTAEGGLYATDGFCTHSNAHLADGFVSGNLVECPKHNGRFDVTDGSPKRPPVCVALRTYQVREHDHKIFLDLNSSGGRGVNAKTETYQLRVVSNENVATFIKELVLEPEPGSPGPEYQPGDYLQFDIPAYGEMSFREIAVKAPYEGVWKAQGWFDGRAENLVATRRNYSFASNPKVDRTLRFNIRLATPPRGQDCSGGAGSAFMHRLKPGDKISASGPFGSFHIQPTEREMIYLGGGSGMAPLRSHLSYLFETRKTTRRVSFWYGARSLQECFYREYFENLAVQNSNFTFHLALSEPQPADHGKSDTGLIHEVLWKKHLSTHPDPTGIEYYLCGPPALVQAALQMLSGLKVDSSQISYDEF
jgi:Na(+)-translocating NADH:ubiquinone oxidoreductase F subunit